jgi:hypothetical protein
MQSMIADLVFNPLTDLGLNVVRYNIGGGDDPAHGRMRPGALTDLNHEAP